MPGCGIGYLPSGPDGKGERSGRPVKVTAMAQAHNEADQERLWTVSEELTGVVYDF